MSITPARAAMLASAEEFLATYDSSLSMNILQQFCRDQRDLGPRLPVIKHILANTKRIDVNDETFEHIVQTSYRIRNRPDAIAEIRRLQHEFTATDDDHNTLITISNPAETKMQLASTAANGGKNKSKMVNSYVVTNKREVTFLPPQIDYEERDDFQQDVDFAALPVDEQRRIQDEIILHLCHSLQAYQTEQQYNDYVDLLFRGTGLKPHPYSEKRGGKILESIIKNITSGVGLPYDQFARDSSLIGGPVSNSNSMSEHASDPNASSHRDDSTTLNQPSPQVLMNHTGPQLVINRTRPYLSALHYICANTQRIPDRYQIIEYLLSIGASANGYRDAGITPLYDIIINPSIPTLDERLNIMRLLLSRGASVNDVDSEKCSLIHVTVNAPHLTTNGKKRVITLLREFSANLNLINQHNHTPLELLIWGYQSAPASVQSLFIPDCGSTEPTPLNIEREDEVVIMSKTIPEPLQHPAKVDNPTDVTTEQSYQSLMPTAVTTTRLYPLTLQSRLDLCQWLLHQGCSITGNAAGTTLLHQLCSTYFPERFEFIKLLVHNNIPSDDFDTSGDTALHCVTATDPDRARVVHLIREKQQYYIKLIQQHEQLMETQKGYNLSPYGNFPNATLITTSYHKNYPDHRVEINAKAIDLLLQVADAQEHEQEVATQTALNKTTLQQIKHPILGKFYTPYQLQQQQNNLTHNDGLAIARLLLDVAYASPFLVNKEEFFALDHHYFHVRGSMALNPKFSSQFLQLCAIEKEGMTNKVAHALELPFTNWMFKQQIAITKLNQQRPSISHSSTATYPAGYYHMANDEDSLFDPIPGFFHESASSSHFEDSDVSSANQTGVGVGYNGHGINGGGNGTGTGGNNGKSIRLVSDISITRHDNYPIATIANEMPIRRNQLQPLAYEQKESKKLDSNAKLIAVADKIGFRMPTQDFPIRQGRVFNSPGPLQRDLTGISPSHKSGVVMLQNKSTNNNNNNNDSKEENNNTTLNNDSISVNNNNNTSNNNNNDSVNLDEQQAITSNDSPVDGNNNGTNNTDATTTTNNTITKIPGEPEHVLNTANESNVNTEASTPEVAE